MSELINKNGKIGIFDSGLGGLSVLSEIHKLLPNEDLLYFGDSKNAPYGMKTKEEVFELSEKICNDFIDAGCKAIVIACNTATSAAVVKLRATYDMPIIGMEPAIKPALEQTRGNVLVLATTMTLKEKKFESLLSEMKDSSRIIKCPAPDFVTLVENDMDDLEKVSHTVKTCFEQVELPLEGLVLGCTHFIFLKNAILDYFKAERHQAINIFDGNYGTALHLKRQLKALDLLNPKVDLGSVSIGNSLGEDYIIKSRKMLNSIND